MTRVLRYHPVNGDEGVLINNDWGNTILGEYLFSITPERKVRIKTIESLQSLKYLPRTAKCQFFEFQILT